MERTLLDHGNRVNGEVSLELGGLGSRTPRVQFGSSDDAVLGRARSAPLPTGPRWRQKEDRPLAEGAIDVKVTTTQCTSRVTLWTVLVNPATPDANVSYFLKASFMCWPACFEWPSDWST